MTLDTNACFSFLEQGLTLQAVSIRNSTASFIFKSPPMMLKLVPKHIQGADVDYSSFTWWVVVLLHFCKYYRFMEKNMSMPGDRRKLYWENRSNDNVVVKPAHNATYSQNGIGLMSCKGNSWTQISILRLVKWYVLQNTYSKKYLWTIFIHENINKFHLTQCWRRGEIMLYFFSLLPW